MWKVGVEYFSSPRLVKLWLVGLLFSLFCSSFLSPRAVGCVCSPRHRATYVRSRE